MKVLFVSRPEIGLREGGVQTQIRETARALEHAGVRAMYHDPWRDQIAEVDLVHAFTCDVSVYGIVRAARSRGIPVVVSPILSAAWPRVIERAKYGASRLPALYTQLRLQREVLRVATRICVLNEEERAFISSLGVTTPFEIIPNGVDRRFAEANPDAYLRHTKGKPDVLFVGRVDRNKNVLRLIRACKQAALRLDVIGFPADPRDPYAAACRSECTGAVRWIGALDHSSDLLPAAYAAAGVFALPSFREVFPLTLLEAVVAGARVVVSRSIPVRSMLGEDAEYCLPWSQGSIIKHLKAALRRPPPVKLRDAFRANYSWTMVAARLRDLYEHIASVR